MRDAPPQVKGTRGEEAGRYNWIIVVETDNTMAVHGEVPVAHAAVSPSHERAAYLAALTGLRFWLALWVILFHLTGRGMLLGSWAESLPPALTALVRGGYVSVNIFFVLSGFVLARGYASTRWNRERLAQYGMRRFARIYPVYALSLVVMAPFILVDRLPWIGATIGTSKAALVANYALLLQGWTGKLRVSWNTPAWSLSCELFFYAMFPLFAIWARRRARGIPVFIIGAAALLPVVIRAAGIPDEWKPLVHSADFLIGVGIAGVYDRMLRTRHWAVGRGAWIYLPAIAASALVIAWPAVLGGSISVNNALRPLCALLILGLGLGGGTLTRLLSVRPIVRLGQASYAIYILHIPIMWWFKCWLGFLFGVVPGGWLALAYVFVVTAAAYAVFVYYEEPMNRWLRSRASAIRVN